MTVAVTPEEMAKAKKAMAEVLAKKQKEAGKTPTATEKKVTNTITSSIAGAAMKVVYEDVEGLGDAAKWQQTGKILTILDGDKILSISCDICDDNAECKNTAIKLAKQLYTKL